LTEVNRLDVVDQLTNSDKVESEYPFFLLYLKSLATGTVSRLVMLKTISEKSIFKSISPYITQILVLTADWRYPQAKAVEFLSQKVPTKDFQRFLYKFSQSISSGEPLPPFIDREFRTFFTEYDAMKNQSLDKLKTLSDAYLPLLSVTLFLCTTMLVSSIFYNPEMMVMLTIMAVVAISIMLYLISWMMFKQAKPDEIMIDQDIKSSTRSRLEKIAMICLGASILSLAFPMPDYFYHIVVVGVLLLIPGYLGKRYINLL